MIRRRTVLAGLAVSALLAGCGGSMGSSSDAPSTGAVPSDGLTVNTALLTFDPLEAKVEAGETVTWEAGDSIRHVLVQGTYEVGSNKLRTSQTDDKAFNLELTKKGQKVSHTYTTAGTFTYYCTVHQGMNGTVVVQ